MVKFLLIIQLLVLTGCDWFGGSSSPAPNPTYSADFELTEEEPILQPCDGARVIPYRVSKCYQNGIPTDLEECSGLIKLPAQFLSPEGNLDEDLLNYKDEIIGKRTYSCEEGQVKESALNDAVCTDSRYIKQNYKGLIECNPYIVDLEKMLSSENRIVVKNINNENSYKNWFDLDFVDYYGNLVFLLDDGLFYRRRLGIIEPYDLLNTGKLVKDFRTGHQCVLYEDNSIKCINPYLQNTLVFFQDDIVALNPDKIDSVRSCFEKDQKLYCIGSEATIKPITQVFDYEQLYSFSGHICFYKNNELFCATNMSTTFYPNEMIFDKISNIRPKKIVGNPSFYCLLEQEGRLMCIGESSWDSVIFPKFSELNELTEASYLPDLKDIYYKHAPDEILGLTMDNKLILIKESSTNPNEMEFVEQFIRN